MPVDYHQAISERERTNLATISSFSGQTQFKPYGGKYFVYLCHLDACCDHRFPLCYSAIMAHACYAAPDKKIKVLMDFEPKFLLKSVLGIRC